MATFKHSSQQAKRPSVTTTTGSSPKPAEANAATPFLRRRVFRLAGPVIGENLLQTLLSITDTILVAGLGVVALAGVGTALQTMFIVIAAMSALAVGASVLVAQAFGGKRFSEANNLARQAVVWSIIISIPVSILGWLLTPAIVSLFRLEPDVAQVSIDYLRITFGTIGTLTIMLLSSSVLRGANDSRTPMLVTAFANAINLVFTYVLIYGVWILPELGASGSAWGTFLSRLIGAIILVTILLRGRNGVTISGVGVWRPQISVVRRLLRIGFPAALEQVLIITAMATLTPIVAELNTLALAAHRVVINVLSLSFLPGIGFGLATTSLVGQAIGAKRWDEARAVTTIAQRWAVMWMGGVAIMFMFFAPWCMRLFTDDPFVIDAGTSSIRVIALTQPLWAIVFVYAGALRGAGDTRTPLLISAIAMWTAVCAAYISVTFIHQSLAAVWAAFWLVTPIQVFVSRWAWRRKSLGKVQNFKKTRDVPVATRSERRSPKQD